MQNKRINWENAITNNEYWVIEFAKNKLSRDDAMYCVPELRKPIRNRGVQEVRRIARKALKRRGLLCI